MAQERLRQNAIGVVDASGVLRIDFDRPKPHRVWEGTVSVPFSGAAVEWAVYLEDLAVATFVGTAGISGIQVADYETLNLRTTGLTPGQQVQAFMSGRDVPEDEVVWIGPLSIVATASPIGGSSFPGSVTVVDPNDPNHVSVLTLDNFDSADSGTLNLQSFDANGLVELGASIFDDNAGTRSFNLQGDASDATHALVFQVTNPTNDYLYLALQRNLPAAAALILGVLTGDAFIAMTESPTPANVPATADAAVLFAKDNGAGKTQFCVKWGDGTTTVIAIQP